MSAETPVQIIQKSTGPREFGTEVVTSPDSSIAAILGASPGASTSVSIIVEVLNKYFPNEMHAAQQQQLKKMLPAETICQRRNNLP